ncbi:MAG: MarR family transcriptional regulator [Rubrobacter sp.]|nr:MarR family transcriptional regulator [Rubrobacter sp.]
MKEVKGEAPHRPLETAQHTSPLLAPLGFAFWRMKSAFERETGVSAGTWFSLMLLACKDGMSQGELSQRFEIDPSRVTRLATRLEREGLLRRERDREDNRVIRLYLTEKGRGLTEGLSGRRERFDQRVGAVLSPKELKELRRMLIVLAEAMQQ